MIKLSLTDCFAFNTINNNYIRYFKICDYVTSGGFMLIFGLIPKFQAPVVESLYRCFICTGNLTYILSL